jgi:hypothetical protein
MRRRKLLAGVAGASTIAAFAGCLSDDEGSGDGGGRTGVASPDIETVAQRQLDDPSESERNVESTATVSGDAETVEIEGTLEAATPCHEAVIADARVEGDTLTVSVELEESGADACAQQISEIEYAATIDVTEGDPTRVVVIHTDRVGETTAADVEL